MSRVRWGRTIFREVIVNVLRFDIEILRTCTRAPFAAAHPFWVHLGFAGVDLALPDARRLAAAIRAAGGAALILPSAYRTPMIPLVAARRIAEQRLDVMRLQREGPFGPLQDGEAHAMWWRFYASHGALPGGGAEPELVCIDVDVVDGHIATLADERQLAAWQRDQPEFWSAAPTAKLHRP